MVSIDAACKGGMLKASNTDKIIVDTTVMLKDIAHPKDSRLLEKSRQRLDKLADEHGIELSKTTTEKLPDWPRKLDATPMPRSTSG